VAAAIYNEGFENESGVVDIRNSIVAANSSYEFEIHNRGIFRSGGHNLFGSIKPGNVIPEPSDRVSVAAEELRLGRLQNNGGRTLTHALLAGSVAIEAGDDSGCLATDQREVARPHYAHCDIGAFEADQLSPSLQCPAPTMTCGATGLETLTFSATVQDPDG